MARKFTVYTYTYTAGVEKEMIGAPSRYEVGDWVSADETKESTLNYRPAVATFKVSVLHDEESQQELAHKLCDYLNAVRSAQEKAVLDDALLQRIMMPYDPPKDPT